MKCNKCSKNKVLGHNDGGGWVAVQMAVACAAHFYQTQADCQKIKLCQVWPNLTEIC
jgi:hypothetical protein